MEWEPVSIFLSIGAMIFLISVGKALASRISGGHGEVVRISKGNKHVLVQPVQAIADRSKALAVYENLAKEKLEVIKTALAMGYNQAELAALDARLEQLIGKEQLAAIANGQSPSASADLASTSLQDEQRRLQELRAK